MGALLDLALMTASDDVDASPHIEPVDLDSERRLDALLDAYARRNNFSAEDRLRDFPPVLANPTAWIDYLQAQLDGFAVDDRTCGAPSAQPIRESSDADPGANNAHSQTALECTRCRHIDMTQGPNHYGRRQFQWVCRRGHRILRAGKGLEDLLLAPSTCNDYDDRPPSGPGVMH